MRSSLILSMLLAAGSITLFTPADSPAVTHIVKPDSSGDFATIKGAIVAAAEGDSILLTDGVFTGEGNVDVNFLGKGITVRSQSGDAAACIIYLEGGPGNDHRGFVFHNGEGLGTSLRDITIRNGYVGLYHGGAGISCDYTSPTITGIIFENCSASSGGAVWCVDGGSPYLGQCSFIGNTSREEEHCSSRTPSMGLLSATRSLGTAQPGAQASICGNRTLGSTRPSLRLTTLA